MVANELKDLIFLSPFPAEDGVMGSTWQGKAGRSPLQALYESDQVREMMDEEGVECWGLMLSSTPPVYGPLTTPWSPWLNLWPCP